MNKMKFWLWCFAFTTLVGVSGCHTNNLIDVNVGMPARNWSYENKVKAVVDIKDANKTYAIYLRLRHTSDYNYSNIYVLFRLKGPGSIKKLTRYEYKLAEADGQWLGSGSGNLFTHDLPLLTNYKFPAPGKYEVSIEQNMRDNPLKEVSDAGLSIAEATAN
jgi:gliding motility-associated lipoprotein GldH